MKCECGGNYNLIETYEYQCDKCNKIRSFEEICDKGYLYNHQPMKKIIGKFLCKIGIHKWIGKFHEKRWWMCNRCGKFRGE